MLPVGGSEQVRGGGRCFRGAEHKQARRFQSVVEDGKNAALRGLLKVDRHIAATHQIEVRKRRVASDIVAGENTAFPDRLINLIIAI